MQKIDEIKDLNQQSIPWFNHLIFFITSLVGATLIIATLLLLRVIDKGNSHIFGGFLIFVTLLAFNATKDDLKFFYTSLIFIIVGEIGIAIGIDYPANLLLIGVLQIIIFFVMSSYIFRIKSIVLFTICMTFFQKDIFIINGITIFFIIFYTALIIYLTFNEKRYFLKSWLFEVKQGVILALYAEIVIKLLLNNMRVLEEMLVFNLTTTFFAR